MRVIQTSSKSIEGGTTFAQLVAFTMPVANLDVILNDGTRVESPMQPNTVVPGNCSKVKQASLSPKIVQNLVALMADAQATFAETKNREQDFLDAVAANLPEGSLDSSRIV